MPCLSDLCDRFPFLRAMKPSSSTVSAPPAYTPSQSALLQRVPSYTATVDPIKPTDTPQWTWTNEQCKEWLFAVCYESLGLSGHEAKAITDKFDGFGPIIYCMDSHDWKKLLGTDKRATSVYAIVFNVQNEPGAVPRGLIIKHGRTKKENKGKLSQPRGA